VDGQKFFSIFNANTTADNSDWTNLRVWSGASREGKRENKAPDRADQIPPPVSTLKLLSQKSAQWRTNKRIYCWHISIQQYASIIEKQFRANF
jgi:hypothetical protein